jgi:hypothetical protein
MNNHNLIQNSQNYFLNRKLITFHSEDRDINKWPDSNNFEVMIPNTLKNIQSMRLVQISIPKTIPVFSRYHKNTKIRITLGDNYNLPYDKSNANDKIIEIPEGTYTSAELATILENAINTAFESKNFKVVYHTGFNKLIFFNKRGPFNLRFDENFDYKDGCETKKIVNINDDNHGLPLNLGYKKQTYISDLLSESSNENENIENSENEFITSSYKLEYNNTRVLSNSSTNYWVNIDNPKVLYNYKPQSLNQLPALIQKRYEIGYIDIVGDKCMYMEIDKYNSMDEIKPYSLNTSASNNNDYNGKTNSAFAKIPLFGGEFVQIFDSANSNIFNVSHYDPPIDSISKLKFKFRFHDGRLVDFKNLRFTFSIEFNMLSNEQRRMANVRVPQFYNLS